MSVDSDEPNDVMTAPERYFDKNRFVPARLANAILKRFAFLTFKDTHEIYCYHKEEGIYRGDGADIVREQVQKRLGDRTTNHYKNEVVEYIRDATLVDRADIEAPRNLIPLCNKILNIDTDEMLDYSREVPFFFKHCGAYNPKILDIGTCASEACKFLESTFPSDEESDESDECNTKVKASDLDIIQEVAGACFYRRSLFKKALMLVGGGDNGKSLFLTALISAVGRDAVSTRTIYDLTFNRFASADLYHKTANIQADIGGGEISFTGRFKTLTGGDFVSAEKKGLQSFSFVNDATMIFSTNDLPEIKRPDSVFYDRWILIEMPVTFVDKLEVDLQEGEHLLDPFLEDKLSEQIEIDWLTTWAIEGLKRLLANGRYTETVSSTDVKTRWINRTDSLAAFVHSQVERVGGLKITKMALYEAYVAYCREAHMTAESIVSVGRRLPQLIATRTIETRPRSWMDITVAGIAPQEVDVHDRNEPFGDVRLNDYGYDDD
jgi:P4 family phage/plasmid primase-like protien